MIINQWFGGMTDSDVVGSDNQYVYGVGVNGKTQADAITLARKTQTPIINTGTHLMFCQYDNDFFLGENGRVYNSSGTNIYTLPGNRPIRNCIKFGDNFLMFYSTGNSIRIARAPFSGLSPNFGSVTLQWGIDENLAPFQYGFSTGVGPYCPAINDSEDVLYFVSGNIVFRTLVTTLGFIQKGLILEEPIVGITKNGSQITAYTVNGKKYFWDGFSKHHDGYVEMGESIRYVQDTRNYDYIVAGGGADIYAKTYISQGQSFQMIRKGMYEIDGVTELRRHGYGMTGLYGNYCIALDEENVYMTTETGQAVECLGKSIVGLPSGTSVDYYNNQVSQRGMIRRKTGLNEGSIGFSYKTTGGTAHIHDIQNFRRPNIKYVSNGLFYTKKYSFGGYKMRAKNYRIRYKRPQGTTIQIFQAINGEKNYTLVTTLTEQNTSDIFTINQSIPFYEIQWKIVMTTSNEDITPTLYSIEFINEPADRQVK